MGKVRKTFYSLSVKRFQSDTSGLAAIEFALILPVMFFLFFGAVEASVAHSAGDRVTRAANMLSDLASLEQQVSPEELADMMIGVQNVIEPIDITRMEMRIVSVVPGVSGQNGNPVVAWSRSSDGENAVPYAPGDSYDFFDNADVIQEGYSVIVAEVRYEHESGITGVLLSDTLVYDVRRLRTPRRTSRVELCELDDEGEYIDCVGG